MRRHSRMSARSTGASRSSVLRAERVAVRRYVMSMVALLTAAALRKLRTEFGEVLVGAAEKFAPAQQALEVKMSIVFPGVSDAAEHLDGCVAHGGQPPGERLRPQRGLVPLAGWRHLHVRGPERMDHTAAG